MAGYHCDFISPLALQMCTGTHKNKQEINNAVMAAEEDCSAHYLTIRNIYQLTSSSLPSRGQKLPTVGKFRASRFKEKVKIK